MIEAKMGILSLLDEVSFFFPRYIIPLLIIHDRNRVYLLDRIKDFVISSIKTLVHLLIKTTLKSLVSQTVPLRLFIMLMMFSMNLRALWIRIRILYQRNSCLCFKTQSLSSWPT
jgi:hypothetical protein